MPRVLAGIFALYTLLFVGVVATEIPPFQNPDEATHFFRAEQLSRRRIMPQHLPNGVAGAFVDSGVEAVAVPFLTLALHPERKATRALYDATAPVRWGGKLTPVAFPNTVIYPPTLYLPAVAGIWAGKALGLSVVHTLYVSRIANGLCATALATLAIALAGSAAPWLFAVLALPMSSALFSAISQDGTMIAATALAAALIARARFDPLSDRRFAALCALLTAICMARPPYAPVACLLLLARWRSPARRAAALLLIASATLGWSVLMLHQAGLNVGGPGADVDPGRQAAALLANPSKALAVATETWRDFTPDYVDEFVGRLANLDLYLPPFIHHLAWAALALAALYGLHRTVRDRSFHPAAAAALAACVLASVTLVFLIQYLTYSSVGSPIVDGIQGRYFIALALLPVVCACSPAPDRSAAAALVCTALSAAVLVYLPVVVRGSLLKFYM